MKKILALALALMLVFAFAACDTKTNEELNNKVEEQTGLNDDFKVGVIHIGDPAAGSGYSYAHDLGIVAMQEDLGLSDSQIVRKNNVDDGDPGAARTAMEECIEEGCKIIFGTSWGYMDTMEELASEYPDVIFSHATGYKSNGSNFNNYFGRIYQARYLSGIAAGLKTESNLIGYVAAMGSDNSEVTGGIDAFAMGVERVNPDAKVYVKVTNSWFDPTLEQQAAEALLDMGCDVIAQHCDTANPQLAAEKKGVWGCGYNSDMTKEAPKAHLTAPIWNWGAYYTKATKAAMEGTWDGSNYFGGMDDGLVALSPLSDNCAEGTREAIEEAENEILSGKDVFTGAMAGGDIIDNNGNVVCAADGALDDATITGGINWYYRNVEVR